MSKPLTFILGFLLVLCVASFIAGYQLNSAAAFTLSGAALLPFVGVFAVGVLDYKVGGSQLTLERRVNSLEKENIELKEVVTALVKSIYVMADGASRWDGPPEHHYDLVGEYLEPIKHLVAPNIKESVTADIAKVFSDAGPIAQQGNINASSPTEPR